MHELHSPSDSPSPIQLVSPRVLIDNYLKINSPTKLRISGATPSAADLSGCRFIETDWFWSWPDASPPELISVLALWSSVFSSMMLGLLAAFLTGLISKWSTLDDRSTNWVTFFVINKSILFLKQHFVPVYPLFTPCYAWSSWFFSYRTMDIFVLHNKNLPSIWSTGIKPSDDRDWTSSLLSTVGFNILKAKCTMFTQQVNYLVSTIRLMSVRNSQTFITILYESSWTW